MSEVITQPTWKTITIEGQSLTGIVTTVRDDRGFDRTTVTDLLGQKIAVVDQKGQLSRYFYDKDGHLNRTVQGTQIRRYEYNDVGWLLSRQEPEEGTTIYSGHNLLGMPKTTTLRGRNGKGQEITDLDWDLHLRVHVLTGKTGSVALVSRTIDYRDDFFVPTQVSEAQPYGSFTESYDYDAAGRPRKKTITDGTQAFEVSRILDALGNVVDLTYPTLGGQIPKTASVAYDAYFRPENLSYDSAQRARMIYEDQVVGSSVISVLKQGSLTGPIRTTSTVNKGELTQVIHANGTDTQTFDMSWTRGGLLLQRGTDKFGYDALQRLNHAETSWKLPNNVFSTETQDFDFDRWGNRVYSFSRNSTGEYLPEVRAWSASYDATNSLPTQVMPLDIEGKITSPPMPTGVIYDNMGRITEVLAIPGDQSSDTQWGYDAAGRVVRENGTTFLLDSEGLRFKRMKPDGSITYTVYGFQREPLSVFEKVAPTVPQALNATKTLASTSTTKSAAPAGCVQTLTGGATSTEEVSISPFTPKIWRGVALTFTASRFIAPDRSFFWDFGDGTYATTTASTVSHTYTANGTYTVSLTASSIYGTAYNSVTTTVVEKPVISLYSGSPLKIYREAGATNPLPTVSTLQWNVAYATSISIDQGIGAVAATGTRTVKPAQTTTYTITVSNLGGTLPPATVIVAVEAEPPPEIAQFGTNLTQLTPGGSAILSWTASNFDSLEVAWNGTKQVVPGTSLSVSPTQATTYTLTATNKQGSVSRDVSVDVLQKPVIQAFLASSERISTGQTTTLKWSVLDFTNLSISGVGDVTTNPTGSISVSPATTTEYELTAVNALNQPVKAKFKVYVGSANTNSLVWKKSMVYGFGQLLSEETLDGVRYIQSNQVGTPNTILDSTGIEIGRSKNLPFGERFGQAGEKSFRRYTNHEDSEDQVSSPIYMQARFYLPMWGRFASPDPARDQHFEETQSWNIYSYCQNNPTMNIDPTGESLWDAIKGAAYAIADNASMGAVGATAQRFLGFNVRAQNRDFYQGAIVGSGVSGSVGTGTAVGGGGATVVAVSTGVGIPVAVATAGVSAYGGAVAVKSGAAVVSFAAMAANAPSGEASAPAEPSGGGGESHRPELTSNGKHHAGASSPEPANVKELYKDAVPASNGTQWVKGKDGVIHRFSAPSNGQTHWNGSTGGKKPIRNGDIPREIRKKLDIKG